jgi:hypothetical protein
MPTYCGPSAEHEVSDAAPCSLGGPRDCGSETIDNHNPLHEHDKIKQYVNDLHDRALRRRQVRWLLFLVASSFFCLLGGC